VRQQGLARPMAFDPITCTRVARNIPAAVLGPDLAGVRRVQPAPDRRGLRSRGPLPPACGLPELLRCAELEQRRSLIAVGQIALTSSSKAAGTRRFTVRAHPPAPSPSATLSPALSSGARALAAAADGSWLASVGLRRLQIWQPVTGAVRDILTGHTTTVEALAAPLDGLCRTVWSALPRIAPPRLCRADYRSCGGWHSRDVPPGGGEFGRCCRVRLLALGRSLGVTET
jgi:hypothetical protein